MKKLSLFITVLTVFVIAAFLGCKKEPPPAPPSDPGGNTGQVLFWTATDLGCGSIAVTCNGTAKQITGYYNSGAPACGAGQAATFDLVPGTYTYSAECSGKTWTGTVTIIANSCTKVQFTGSAASTGQAMFWSASDLGCGNITVNCNGVTRTLSSFYSAGAPACGASGTATFDLAPGTYSYSAQCSGKAWNGTVTITANSCSKIQFTGSIATTGQAMFWSASDLGCGNITVTCNGVTRTLSSFYSSGAPACGASGAATFDFAPGTYSYSAQCSGKTWSGTVTISANGCSKVQFTGSVATTGQAMFWTASDLACGNISVTCNGVTRTISSYYSSGAPSCGANGSATFTLNPGTYSFSGKCSSKTWNGTITVNANGCSKLQFTN